MSAAEAVPPNKMETAVPPNNCDWMESGRGTCRCSVWNQCRPMGGRGGILVTSDEGDDDWKAAEDAQEAARRLPGGAARIEALKQAGRLRFDADRKRQQTENRQAGAPSNLKKPTG